MDGIWKVIAAWMGLKPAAIRTKPVKHARPLEMRITWPEGKEPPAR
jgi:hypothetical protein